MITRQNYAVQNSDTNSVEPNLPHLVEVLQNILLLSQEPAFQRDYVLVRSVEDMTTNLATCIGRLDSKILEAIHV